MLSFMGENKRLLNIHEKKFVELEAFQANTTVFRANTNASLKNMGSQLRQLALKNPKDYMAIPLRSGRELENREEEKKKQTENQEKAETRRDNKMNSSEITTESEKSEV